VGIAGSHRVFSQSSIGWLVARTKWRVVRGDCYCMWLRRCVRAASGSRCTAPAGLIQGTSVTTKANGSGSPALLHETYTTCEEVRPKTSSFQMPWPLNVTHSVFVAQRARKHASPAVRAELC